MKINIVENATFEEIRKILDGLSKKDYSFLFSRANFIDSPNAKLRLIAKVGREPAGFLEGYIFPESTNSIVLTVAVLSNFRGQGIATTLIQHAEEYAQSHKIKYIIWRVDSDNHNSIKLAEKLGYHVYKSTKDQVRYEKVLESLIRNEVSHMDHFQNFHNGVLLPAQEAVLFSTEKSQARKIENFATIDRAIGIHIKMLEEFVVVANKYLKDIASKPNVEDVQKPLGVSFIDTCISLDYARAPSVKELKKMGAAYVRNKWRVLDRADMKKENVREAESKLMLKLIEGGDYANRLHKLTDEFKKIYDKIVSAQAKYKPELFRWKGANTAASEYNWFVGQLRYTIGDLQGTLNISVKHGYKTEKEDGRKEDK